MTVEEQINEIHNKKKSLALQIKELSDQEFEIHKRELINNGYSIGANISFKGNIGKIVGYRDSNNQAFPNLSFYNKNGELSKRISNVYSFEMHEIKLI